MSRFTKVVSAALSLLAVGLTVGACSSAASSSEETESSPQDLSRASGGSHAELWFPPPLPPIHIFPRPEPTFSCSSSATCWVWPRTQSDWDPSFPNGKFEDENFQTEMIAASCAPELYFTDSNYSGGVPHTNQDQFQIGFVALCKSVPPGAWAVDPLPNDCGCSAIPPGYTLISWRPGAGRPLPTCGMAGCRYVGDPPPPTGLPGEPLPDQQD